MAIDGERCSQSLAEGMQVAVTDGERCSQSLAEGMQVAVTDGERCSQSLAGTQPLKRKQRAAARRRTRPPLLCPAAHRLMKGLMKDGAPWLMAYQACTAQWVGGGGAGLRAGGWLPLFCGGISSRERWN